MMDTAQQQVLQALIRLMQDSQLQLQPLAMHNKLQTCSCSRSMKRPDLLLLLGAVAAEGSELQRAA
jgi:hypothetical protein